MEPESYSASYLKLFSDVQNSSLLNANEVDDNFSVEHIFTEVDTSNWPNVLLNGPLVSEGSVEYENTSINDNIQLFTETEPVTTTNKSNEIKDSIEQISNQNIISPENFVLSNDILLQINPPIQNELTEAQEEITEENYQIIDDDDAENATTYITYAPVIQDIEDKPITNFGSDNIVELIDGQGNIIALDKTIYIKPEVKPPSHNIEDMFTSVNAVKCKICNFVCESILIMKSHVLQKHPEKCVNIIKNDVQTKNKIGSGKMVSILNTNKIEMKKTMFMCSMCTNVYNEKEKLKEHMINDHKLTSTKEESTEEAVTKDDNNLNDEEKLKSIKTLSEFLVKKQQKALKKVKCTIKGCNSKFAKDELRKRHEACHVGDNKKQFQCPECKELFSIWRICSSHLWKCHKIDMGLLTCPMCNKFKSSNTVLLLRHMAIHNDEKPYLCSECGKSFKQLPQLKNHEVVHRKDGDSLPNWSMMKQCEVCDRYFANSKSYRKHVLFVHEKFKPFFCNICGHKTARKAMLQLHMRQHTGFKPHHCPQCDYKTGDHNSLRRHIMRHFGAAKYSCPYCSYTSIQSTSYKNHLENRHPGKTGNFKCTYCTYSTINFASYASHMKCHEANMKNGVNNDAQQSSKSLLLDQSSKETATKELDAEDDETQNCFLNLDTTEDTIDTGGITIPAGLELQLQS